MSETPESEEFVAKFDQSVSVCRIACDCEALVIYAEIPDGLNSVSTPSQQTGPFVANSRASAGFERFLELCLVQWPELGARRGACGSG